MYDISTTTVLTVLLTVLFFIISHLRMSDDCLIMCFLSAWLS